MSNPRRAAQAFTLAALAALVSAGTAQASPLPGCYDLQAGGDAVERLWLEPTTVGSALLHDTTGRLVDWRNDRVARRGTAETASASAEWRFTRSGSRYLLRTRAGRPLVLTKSGRLTLGRRATRFALRRATGCRAFPQAELNVSGDDARAVNENGTLFGYADTHLHITADMRAGGSVLHGKAFDRFGIPRALGGDAGRHGADGSQDYTGNLLREGVPFGTHDTMGWPSFTGWPTSGTNTHQQTYWKWLERAHRSGLRLVVAHTVEDEQICEVQPFRAVRTCDETAAVRRQVRRLRELEDHVDAQSGGRGRGWLRIVESPARARRVMRQGKLAVVLGVESSYPLGCRAQEGEPACTPAQVDRRLDELHDLGIRSLFIAHWADNGFAGAALQSGVKGKFINAMHRLDVGRWFEVEQCTDPRLGEPTETLSDLEIDVVSQFFPETNRLKGLPKPTYPEGKVCNTRGLTKLGEHLVRRMMQKGMLIEVDHLSEKARDRVIELAERARYPLVSGHNETGGAWTPEQLRRLHALGGIASQTFEQAPLLARRITERARDRSSRFFFGVGLGTDTGGFASLPAVREDAAAKPVRYPFRAFGGGPSFQRQRTGTRTFDLNRDGVAHYGLLPDLLADVAQQPQGERALALLYRSGESYVRMWERAERRR